MDPTTAITAAVGVIGVILAVLLGPHRFFHAEQQTALDTFVAENEMLRTSLTACRADNATLRAEAESAQ